MHCPDVPCRFVCPLSPSTECVVFFQSWTNCRSVLFPFFIVVRSDTFLSSLHVGQTRGPLYGRSKAVTVFLFWTLLVVDPCYSCRFNFAFRIWHMFSFYLHSSIPSSQLSNFTSAGWYWYPLYGSGHFFPFCIYSVARGFQLESHPQVSPFSVTSPLAPLIFYVTVFHMIDSLSFLFLFEQLPELLPFVGRIRGAAPPDG